MKISVCLATFNEEKNIKDCLDSVKGLADEIIVVDGSSTDKTVAIARKHQAKVIVRENPVMFHLNKQKAFEAAAGDWILYLDADERVTPELKKEILKIIVAGDAAEKNQINGFWLPRKNIIFGKWIKHSGWYPDYQLRFFRRGQAFLPCQSVHEQPQLKGEAGYLKNPLLHYNYQTVWQFVNKLNNLYTENDKNVFLAKNKKLNWSDFIQEPAAEFLRRFFQKKGYQDGLHGLVLSLLQSFSVLVSLAKVWEKQGFPETESVDFIGAVEKESKKAAGQLRYWFLSGRIEKTKNLGRRLLLRLRRKLKI